MRPPTANVRPGPPHDRSRKPLLRIALVDTRKRAVVADFESGRSYVYFADIPMGGWLWDAWCAAFAKRNPGEWFDENVRWNPNVQYANITEWENSPFAMRHIYRWLECPSSPK
ncbi:MAG TPA: hypothetical protein VN418_07640 [Gammaproteobacteria bacterium]|nr:hypothetical protein [Gammaproteobacteria bacterium]